MPLRVRLAIAFAAVLLGPALVLGALAYRAIGSGQRAATDAARTDLAVSAVRGQMLAECDRLTATARTIAVQAAVRHQPSAITPAGPVGVWALWSASGALLTAVLPQEMQARGAALQVVLIGVALAGVLLARPRGLLGEEAVVSRHARLTLSESRNP